MTRAGAPLLFLDFDGVLHPASAYATAPFSRAPLLEEALAGFEVRLVVSSSWRFHHSLPEIRSRLPRALASRLVGTTGDPHLGQHARYHEIHAWLGGVSDAAPWRALDDSAFEFPSACAELILCDPNIGLDEAVAGHLRDWLLGTQR